MKKLILILPVIVLCWSCGRTWTQQDRDEFLQSCITNAIKDTGPEKAKAYCQCMLAKIEKRYPNVKDVAYLRSDTTVNAMVRACRGQQ
ncbi:MAG TPA: hypothetical protein VFZ78_10600 [Flavisolibacter sp.]